MFSRGRGAALRRGSESRRLSLTHCNVSTFLSGSANLAASLSNFSWQGPGKNRRGKSTHSATVDSALLNTLSSRTTVSNFLHHQSFVLYIVARGDRKYTIKVCRPLFVAPTRLRNRAGCAPDTNVWDPRNPRFEIGDLSRNFRKKRDQIQLIPILPEIEYLKIPCFQSLLPFLKGNLVVKILGCNVAGRDEKLSRKAIMRDHELNR